MIQAKRLLQQGCQTYLAQVVDTEKSAPKLEEIPVVNEFEDVYPEDLHGLPPNREIGFTIDLDQGTTLVLEAPYRIVDKTEGISNSNSRIT